MILTTIAPKQNYNVLISINRIINRTNQQARYQAGPPY